MTIGEFISDRLGKIMLFLCCTAAAALLLRATGTSPGVLILLLLFLFLIFTVTQTSEYLKCRRHLSGLNALMQGLDQKYLFFECAPSPCTVYEQKLFELMRDSGRSMIGAVSDAQASMQEYREYIESWVHEIKTPITAAKLTCRHLDSDSRRRFSAELEQIEAHVERALYYARAQSPEHDCIVCQVNLADVVSQAVGNHRTLLIQSHMQIETGDLDFTIYTDRKWAVFILGQLLQNASHYRRIPSPQTTAAESPHAPDLNASPPSILLTAKPLGRQLQLTVSDNGIGIPAHELFRVFDRGFTGSNGRLRGGSTGMGLYLCRKLASMLEIDMQIASEKQKGTAVTLTFPAKQTAETANNRNLTEL